jgi:membrane protease YdiL (CAAX protease family)/uncharacterized RDD family membrane protein YckC
VSGEVGQAPPIPEDFVHAGTAYRYAGFARRLAAALLDSAVWIVGIVMFFPGWAFEGSETAALVASIVLFSAWFNYFAFCEWRWGQTIGKNAFGIRVLPLDGGELGWSDAAMRNLLRLVDLPLAMIGVLYLIVRASPRRQRLGDRAAHTIVVREQPAAPPPAPTMPPPSPGPTSGEIFSDAAEALGAVTPGAALPHGASPAKSNRWDDFGAESRAAERDHEQPGDAPPRTSSGGLPYADWPVGRTLRAVILGILLGGLVLPIPVIVVDPELESHGALIAVQAILGATFVATSLIAAGGDWPDAMRRLGSRRFRPSAFGWMALSYFAYLVAIAIYASFVVEPDQEDIARELGLDSETIAAAFSVLLIAIVAPFAEELFFRGLLYGGLRVRMPVLPAALLSGLVFGGLHVTTGITTVPPLVFLGVALALLYEKTGSLWPPIIVHCVNNSLALALSA